MLPAASFGGIMRPISTVATITRRRRRQRQQGQTTHKELAEAFALRRYLAPVWYAKPLIESSCLRYCFSAN